MSIEKLINLDSAKVSWKEYTLFETSASITVLIQEDIRESRHQSIPEFLQMVPEVNVAKIDSNKLAIKTGSFNSLYAEKLGERAVYVPLSSDAYMNVFDVTLEDIESKVVCSKRAPAINLRPQNPDPFFSSKSQFQAAPGL